MNFWKKIKILLNIFLLILASYIVMVFISHFSVYNKSDNYQLLDSFSAMLFKTDVPAEYFIYFGIHIVLIVLLALFVNFIVNKFSRNRGL